MRLQKGVTIRGFTLCHFQSKSMNHENQSQRNTNQL